MTLLKNKQNFKNIIRTCGLVLGLATSSFLFSCASKENSSSKSTESLSTSIESDTNSEISSSSSSINEIYYVVSFIDGSSTYPINVKENEKVTPPSVSKQGYSLEGWYLENTLITKFNLDTPITSSFNLYAKWELVWGPLV